MESLSLLADGIWIALQPGNLLFAGIGVLLGTLVGILPGISPSLTVALLLPTSTTVGFAVAAALPVLGLLLARQLAVRGAAEDGPVRHRTTLPLRRPEDRPPPS